MGSKEQEKAFVEVAGLFYSTGGRKCNRHNTCGDYISFNSILVFKKSKTTIVGGPEEFMTSFFFDDSVSFCKVGYLPRYLKKIWDLYEGVKDKLVDYYRVISNTITLSRSARMGGMCNCEILEEDSPTLSDSHYVYEQQ